MHTLFKYFWFLGVPLALLNVPLYWLRARPHLAAGAFTRKEVSNFLWGSFLLISLPSLALGSLQLLGGFSTPFAMFCRPQEGVWPLLSWAVIAALYLWALWWLWFAKGDAALAKMAPLLNLPRSAGLIRWASTVLLLGLFSLFAVSLLTGSLEICELSQRFGA